jgi:hypothetical protein
VDQKKNIGLKSPKPKRKLFKTFTELEENPGRVNSPNNVILEGRIYEKNRPSPKFKVSQTKNKLSKLQEKRTKFHNSRLATLPLETENPLLTQNPLNTQFGS